MIDFLARNKNLIANVSGVFAYALVMTAGTIGITAFLIFALNQLLSL